MIRDELALFEALSLDSVDVSGGGMLLSFTAFERFFVPLLAEWFVFGIEDTRVWNDGRDGIVPIVLVCRTSDGIDGTIR